MNYPEKNRNFFESLKNSTYIGDIRKRQFVFAWLQNFETDIEYIVTKFISIPHELRYDFIYQLEFRTSEYVTSDIRVFLEHYMIFIKTTVNKYIEKIHQLFPTDISGYIRNYLKDNDIKDFLYKGLLQTVYNSPEWDSLIEDITSENKWCDTLSDNAIENALRCLTIDLKLYIDFHVGVNQFEFSEDENDIDF